MLSPFMAKRSHLVIFSPHHKVKNLQGLRPKKKDDYLENPPENHRGSHNPPTIRKIGSLYLPPDAAPGPLGLSFDKG